MPLLHPLPDVQRRYIPAARYLRGLKVGSYGSVVARSGMWSTQLVDGFDPDKSAVACAALISECIEGNSLTYGGAIGDCIDRRFRGPGGYAKFRHSQEHRRRLPDRRGGRADRTTLRVGRLVDAWRGNFED